MKSEFPKISLMGERAILIEFEPEINENVLQKILFFKNSIEKKLVELNVEVINTYNSLLISYKDSIEDVYSAFLTIEEVIFSANIGKIIQPQLFYIPVCYEPEFGWDLELMVKEKKLSPDQIVDLHTHPVYNVYFIGFLPGFLYLGGLDKRLQISRKDQPRLVVQKGAVGIGENQTGIYPKSSPGGWQIIGNSPVELFDKNRLPPCEISAGDKVKFYPVSKNEFLKIQEAVTSKNFQLKRENYES